MKNPVHETTDSDHPDWPLRKPGEYYLLFHSVRCRFHLAHPVSVMQAREMLWNALLRCTDGACFVTVGTARGRTDVSRITQREVHQRYKKITGQAPGYVSREERSGITDPKTTRELATWMAQQRKKTEQP